MATMQINRDAPVQASDGEAGRVMHVVLDPDTKEVTDLIIEGSNGRSIVPIGAVVRAEAERVLLGISRAEVARQPFAAAQYHGIDETVVREESQHIATHGGAPLLDADQDGVDLAGTPRTGSQPPIPTAGALPYELRRHGSPPAAVTGRLQPQTVGAVPPARLSDQGATSAAPTERTAAREVPPVGSSAASAPRMPPVPPLERPLAPSSAVEHAMPRPPVPPAAARAASVPLPPSPTDQHHAVPTAPPPPPSPFATHTTAPSAAQRQNSLSQQHFDETIDGEESRSGAAVWKRASLAVPALVLPALGIALGMRYARLATEQRRVRILAGTLAASAVAVAIAGLLGRLLSKRANRAATTQTAERWPAPRMETVDDLETDARLHHGGAPSLHERPLVPRGTNTAAPATPAGDRDRPHRD